MNTDYPIKIKNEEGNETLNFNPKEMELHKLYTITWNGQYYALQKIDEAGTVKFYLWEVQTDEL